MNKRSPDVRGIGVAEIDLKCIRCGQLIKAGEQVQIAISYAYHYDYAIFYHVDCQMFDEMVPPTGAV